MSSSPSLNPLSGEDLSPGGAHSESCWEQIVRAALLGSERVSFPALNHGADSLLSQLDPARREASLLSAAAIVSLHQRCGAVPAQTSAAFPKLAEEDALPRCGAGAAAYLKRLLNGEHSLLLPEFQGADIN